MNYYQAREVQRDGKGTGIWHWTCRNGADIWVTPPCTDECQHLTAEEAERHYWQDRRENLREESIAWHACGFPGCDKPTQKTLGSRAHFGGDPLCDDHRTPEVWDQLHPFTSGIRVISS